MCEVRCCQRAAGTAEDLEHLPTTEAAMGRGTRLVMAVSR